MFNFCFSHQNNSTVVEIHNTECSNNNVLGASLISTGDKHSTTGPGTMGYCDINVPVYATVKGVSMIYISWEIYRVRQVIYAVAFLFVNSNSTNLNQQLI